MGIDGDSNGSAITRRELASELRAARAEDRNETERVIREAVKPVVDRLQLLDRGEFSPGLRAGILEVVENEKDENWLLRSNKAGVISVGIVLAGLLANVILNLYSIGL